MTPERINRLLVANRGEIARRVFATCRTLGIGTVAIYSDADAGAPHRIEADLAVRLPGNTAAQTYLRTDLILDAAARTGADAIHPGYGFLSENPQFARSVIEAGLIWIGPPPEAIAAVGAKIAAKRLAARAGVSVLASWTRADQVRDFPVLVKADLGGGGRGMRIVTSPDQLASAMAHARREAAAAFGDGRVFCEQYLADGRHIEVQILADASGRVVAVGERDCSIQRRHQKILEEAPSAVVDAELRAALGEAAARVARATGYIGAGTVEFLLAADGRYYFLEMNARLQVEHPVTECVTGLDLVGLQIAIAQGQPLPFAQAPPIRGHAIEARLYAEDPTDDWRPSTGMVHRFDLRTPADAFTPLGAYGLRCDSGISSGSEVSVHYDPMLAKVIAWADNRGDAARALAAALARAHVHGVHTNRDLLVRVLRSPDFLDATTDTGFLDRHPEVFSALLDTAEQQHLTCLAAALVSATARRVSSPWRALPIGWRNLAWPATATSYATPWGAVRVSYRFDRDGTSVTWSVVVNDQPAGSGVAGVLELTPQVACLDVAGCSLRYEVQTCADATYVDSIAGSTTLVEVPRLPLPRSESIPGGLAAPMPGAVGRIVARIGQRLAAGDVLLTLEAMKLEHPVRAPHRGVLADLFVQSGQQVTAGQILAVVTEEEP